jgi:predicted nuclease of predicted toxin-antitoxin system
MKFLVDAQLPPGLCVGLARRGHDAVHVFDIGLGGASDVEIVDWAVANDFGIISKDEDFLTLRLPDRFCFLWLRVGNVTTKHLAGWMDARWDRVEELLASGERLIELR